MNNPTIEAYYEIKQRTDCNDVAAAILVLAQSIDGHTTFSRKGAENFGHELALALKNVLSESNLSVYVSK